MGSILLSIKDTGIWNNMQVIKPTTFADADLISSNAVETYAAYSAVTTYAKDAIVDYGTHYYISLVNSNLNHQPDISPTFWLLKGPDNTHAMFDGAVDSRTTSTSPLTVTVKTGTINSAAFINLTGTTLVITARDGSGGTVFWTETVNLDGTIIIDWYEYFFEPYDQLSDVVFTDIPPYSNCHLTMELTSGSDVAIGQFVYGNVYDIGMTQYGASTGIRDYSVKETDIYGVTSLVQRTFSKRFNAEVMLDNPSLRKVSRLLTDLRAVPCVWIGSSDADYEPLIVYGFYRDFNIAIQYPSYSLASIEVEGLS